MPRTDRVPHEPLPKTNIGKILRRELRDAAPWWAVQGSNLRPLPCEGSALPLS
jgi:hypothetical protein